MVEAHDLGIVLRIPNSDSPISGGGNEGSFMEIVPSDFIDGQKMPSVGFLILTRIRSGTFVDLSFFGTDYKDILVKFVEIKAETTG